MVHKSTKLTSFEGKNCDIFLRNCKLSNYLTKNFLNKLFNFLKKYKAENINAIELCQTASVVIYNYFVSCLCCDQETSWFRNILADII